jgi:hypothetical protein
MLCRTASLLVALVVTVPLEAQGPTLDAAQSGLGRCTYETCALRRERTMFGGSSIVTGRVGAATPMGLLGGGLVLAVERVPGALVEAQQGRRNAIIAAIAGVVGGLAISLALQNALRDDILAASDGQFYGSILVGVGATAVFGVNSVRADRHFSRAVWLYNGELPR